jgi:hypothetical protein
MRKKLFSSDWAIREYSVGGNANIIWPSSTPGMSLHSLGKLTLSMLSVEPLLRPSALEVREQLRLIRLQDAGLQVRSYEGGAKCQGRYKIADGLNAALPIQSLLPWPPSIPPFVRPLVHPRYRQPSSSDTVDLDDFLLQWPSDPTQWTPEPFVFRSMPWNEPY